MLSSKERVDWLPAPRSVALRVRRDGLANAGRKLWFEEILMYYNTLEFLCGRSKANSNNSRF